MIEFDTQKVKGELLFPSIVTAGIMIAGLLNLYSSTSTSGNEILVIKQLIWDILSIGVIIFLANLPWRTTAAIAHIAMAAVILSLCLVLVVGKGPGDVKRWIVLGPLRFQPSEFVKPLVVLLLSVYLAPYLHEKASDIKKIFITGIISAPPALLIVLEPDLGTAVVVLLTAAGVLLIVGLSRRTLVVLTVVSLIAVPLVWKYGLKPYQKKRIEAFINPEKDPLGAGYQTLQSKISVGSGGVWGKGYLKGTQTRLRFLPEQHTDFAFSVWAEEWGLVGSILVLSLYFLLSFFFADGAVRARSASELLVKAGCSIHITLHVFFNLGMVTGILPVVGLPLPFFSYGGSSALATAMLMGFALSSRKAGLFDRELY